MRPFFLIAVLLCRGILSADAHAETFSPNQTVVYKEVGPWKLKLHVFNPANHASSDKRPALVLFFGGGWRNGSPEQFYPQCAYFASRGMVAISAEYRVLSKHGTSPRECVKDGKSAIRWIRTHANQLGIDPDKVAAGGGSAGGHVAAATATVNGMNEEGEDASIRCRPDALVLFSPVFDNGPSGYGYDRVKPYWKDISPLHNLDAQTPPTIVFLGTQDHLVPVATARRYRKQMIGHGGRCDVHFYKGQEHGFFHYKNTTYFARTVVEADRFLASLEFLTGDPTLTDPSEAGDTP